MIRPSGGTSQTMKRVDVLPLTVDLMELFYRSARDALYRAKDAAGSHPYQEVTGLTIFPQRQAETQATVESVIASFFAVEAAVNYVFLIETEGRRSGTDRWLKRKWKGGLSLSDKLLLLFSQYAVTDLERFQNVVSLFQEFVICRNQIVHPYPERYEALVEFTDLDEEALIHAVNPYIARAPLSHSGLSRETARIAYPDAARCYEIMLLVLALLDAQFVVEMQLSWYEKPAEMAGLHAATPSELLNSLKHRYYPKIDPITFVPDLPT